MGELVILLNSDKLLVAVAESGLHVGQWGQLDYVDSAKSRKRWIHQRAPAEARQLQLFSKALCGWFSTSQVIIKFDHSTSLSGEEVALIDSLLNLQCSADSLYDAGFVLDISSSGDEANRRTVLQWFIFACLMFEAHAQIAEMHSREAKILSLQDGFAYFICLSDADMTSAHEVLRVIQ